MSTVYARRAGPEAAMGKPTYPMGTHPLWLRKTRPADSRTGRIAVTIPGDARFLGVVRAIIGEVSRSLCLDQMTAYSVKSAVGEALTNAVEHGCPRKEADRVTVKIWYSLDELRVDVMDRGPAFCPPGESTSCSQGPRGYGIYLMRTLMDKVAFSRIGESNRVRLIKRIDSSCLDI